MMDKFLTIFVASKKRNSTEQSYENLVTATAHVYESNIFLKNMPIGRKRQINCSLVEDNTND